ncbi:multicopy membrane protein [Schizosaccharomyces octosporus yFS286]|uniref:Multicopy membrane protein n=1 Tax=Schizosaccharomyces octosporus (strain yFS286) TaxID=483514 RepID=S9PX78_SCHOY|nr:multicopy membrane protein [Schizosaccharomyces octosporus yFS286]EPX72582.1 multicopy membrane protein [Schizosaccharomyces octosporus yFS286]
MLFSSWIGAAYFVGSALATISYDPLVQGASSYKYQVPKQNPNTNPYYVQEESLAVFPFDEPLGGHAFVSGHFIDPIVENDTESAYVELLLKPNVSARAVFFRSIFYPDLFQGYKHAIDGFKDFEFLKNLSSGDWEPFHISPDSDVLYSKQQIYEPGMHFFVGFYDPTLDYKSSLPGESITSMSKQEVEPVIQIRYKSGDHKDTTQISRFFIFLSVISSCIGFYWAIRWFRNPQKVSFTQLLLLTWYIAFLFNHPIKQSVFSNKDLYKNHQDLTMSSIFFSYIFGDGIERPLFNSFSLASSFGMGYARRSSKKLIFLVILLTWLQMAFIICAPLVFPILSIFGSSKAKSLQVSWMLFNFGYIPSVFFIGYLITDRKSVLPGTSRVANIVKHMVFILLSTCVSLSIYMNSAASFDYISETLKIIYGVLYFCVAVGFLNEYEQMVNVDTLNNSQELSPLCDDDIKKVPLE